MPCAVIVIVQHVASRMSLVEPLCVLRSLMLLTKLHVQSTYSIHILHTCLLLLLLIVIQCKGIEIGETVASSGAKPCGKWHL